MIKRGFMTTIALLLVLLLLGFGAPFIFCVKIFYTTMGIFPTPPLTMINNQKKKKLVLLIPSP